MSLIRSPRKPVTCLSSRSTRRTSTTSTPRHAARRLVESGFIFVEFVLERAKRGAVDVDIDFPGDRHVSSASPAISTHPRRARRRAHCQRSHELSVAPPRRDHPQIPNLACKDHSRKKGIRYRARDQAAAAPPAGMRRAGGINLPSVADRRLRKDSHQIFKASYKLVTPPCVESHRAAPAKRDHRG
jgi:hypothetical protein